MLFALAAGLAAAPQLALAQPVPQVRPGNRVETRFDVPGGPLGAALDRFARTAGISLPYDPALVAERTTRGLEGSYGVAAGLAALLAGTDLEPVAQAGGRFTVRRKPEAGPEERADTTLREVKVSAQAWSKPAETPAPHKGGQVARGARLGILGNVDLMDAPFNVTAYTEQTIVDQQSVTVGEVLRNDPSVRFTTPDGHNAENFTIRGFDLNSSELAFNGMYGMLSGAHVPTEFLERVEIFRGPSAMLSGMSPSSAVGGVINLVPKRAGSRDVTRLTTKYASGARLGLAADIGRRFGGEKRLGIRFNGTHSDGETPLDGQKKREQFASLGVDYLGDRWTLDLDAYVSRQNQTNGSPLMVGFATLGQVLEAPDSSRNALRGTFARQDTQGAMVRGEFELSSHWSTYASLGTARYTYDGYLNGTRVVVLNDRGDARGQTYNQAGYTRGVTAEAGVRGRFSTGAVAHEATASASRLDIKQGLAGVATSATYTTSIYAPIPNPTLAGAHGAIVDSADNTFTGLSLTDRLSALDGKAVLTLGARHQRVRQSLATPKAYDEKAVTPMAGLVLKPWGRFLSLYANYIEGLAPGLTVGSTYANQGEVLAPQKTRQTEAGLKWEAAGFTTTLSLFSIEKPSTVNVNTSAPKPTLALDGQQRNRGLEWNSFGQITPRFRLLGGVAYTQGEQLRASIVANNGKDAPGVPRWTANLGGEWDSPWAPGLTLSVRLNSTSSQYLDAANALELPSWHRWDLGARYTTRIAGHPAVLRATVENLENEAYWAGRFNEGFATVGAPRTFKLSLAMDF